MGVAIQAGLLAAFVVVFLPLGMAGWHLTRNRLLFFSTALFITLAVSVHLLPYFPSFSIVFSPSSFLNFSSSVPDSHPHCLSLVHDVEWEDLNVQSEEEEGQEEALLPQNASDPCMMKRLWTWKLNASTACGFQKVNRTDALELLKGSWIMVAGDSQARFFLLSLLDLLLQSVDPVREKLFKRHNNYRQILEEQDVKLDFIWAPYSTNITRLVVELRHNHSYPDVLIMGDGLWHMLHYTNASDYSNCLGKLHREVLSLIPVTSYFNSFPVSGDTSAGPVSSLDIPHMFWLNVPTLISSVLNTAEKREKLTAELCALYERELAKSKLLQPEGPLTLLNLRHLSHGCGPACTNDGMHYCDMVYEVAVQLMLNALLIATHQAPAK